MGSLKNPTFRGGEEGFTKNQYRGGEGKLPKRGGAWTVCQFKGGGLARKRRVVFLRVAWYPNAHYVLNLVFLLSLPSQTYPDAVKVWTHWYMYTLYRSPADHRRDHTSPYYCHPHKKFFLYYPLMGLCFWPWNFLQQEQGFHSREVREFMEQWPSG